MKCCNKLYTGPINSIIKSKTRFISHANPKYVTISVSEVGRIGLIDYWVEDWIVELQRHTMEMEVEQMMERLLAEMKAMQAKMDANQEMTGRLDSKTEANQAKTDVNLKEIKEKILAKMEPNQERMMACLEKAKEPTPQENEVCTGAGESPQGRCRSGAREQEPPSSCRAPWEPEATDPGQWWMPEETDCRPRRENLPQEAGKSGRLRGGNGRARKAALE
jgi:hypothetical protein